VKFSQLPLGARFEYQGRVYVKTSPLAASGEAGGQKLIPRYAELTPLDGAPTPVTRPNRVLDETTVLAAFEAFAADCQRLLDRSSADVTQHRLLRAELEAARQRFLDSLA